MLHKGTHFVLDDELAVGLFELNFKSPDQQSRRRYEIILVKRGDEIAEYRRDMGLAKKYKSAQLRIPSLMVHTVGELRDIANHARMYPPYDIREITKTN